MKTIGIQSGNRNRAQSGGQADRATIGRPMVGGRSGTVWASVRALSGRAVGRSARSGLFRQQCQQGAIKRTQQSGSIGQQEESGPSGRRADRRDDWGRSGTGLGHRAQSNPIGQLQRSGATIQLLNSILELCGRALRTVGHDRAIR